MWLLLAVVIGAGFGGKASTVSSPQLQQMMSSAERIFAESGHFPVITERSPPG